MLSFRTRATETEIIDDMTLGETEMSRVLRNLATVNRFLGGYATTIRAIGRLVPGRQDRLHILDVGAGGGDMARRLVAWGRETGRDVRVVTVDLNRAAASYARRALADEARAFVVRADVLALPFAESSFDVVTCSLFAHHFPTPVVARFLVEMHAIARRGVVVNDLHRHPLAFAGIWALTRLLGASPIVCHDGPLSVRRAFVRADFRELARMTRLELSVRWRWAFRWQVVVAKSSGDGASHA